MQKHYDSKERFLLECHTLQTRECLLTELGRRMKQTLMELVRQVRGHTLRLLEIEDAPWQRWSPAGTSNHYVWHAGHILWGQDLLSIQALGQPSELSVGWAEKFGEKCQPVTATIQWPLISELRELLGRQQNRILELLDDAEEALSKPSEQPLATGWPLLEGIVHACHDEARHQGEMYLLYKMTRSAGEQS